MEYSDKICDSSHNGNHVDLLKNGLPIFSIETLPISHTSASYAIFDFGATEEIFKSFRHLLCIAFHSPSYLSPIIKRSLSIRINQSRQPN